MIISNSSVPQPVFTAAAAATTDDLQEAANKCVTSSKRSDQFNANGVNNVEPTSSEQKPDTMDKYAQPIDLSIKKALKDIMMDEHRKMEDTPERLQEDPPLLVIEPAEPEINPAEVVAPRKFVGLVNPSNTCYLNSMLQVLFMTPEFRDVMLSLDPHDLDPNSLPLELQVVFAKLNNSTKAVDPSALVKCIEHNFSSTLEQMDIQEFANRFFDILENHLTDSEGTFPKIKDHYYGKLIDSVQCLKCKNTSQREDAFRDVSLAIEGCSSLEEALAGFVKPEMLCGNNQYMCEHCKGFQDATKGLSFKELPTVLSFALKRFDSCGMKNNEKMTFGQCLDMEPYLNSKKEPEANETPEQDKDQKYELFGVLIHRGMTTSGHYYAYVKSFESGKWFSFNDERVRRIGVDEVEQAYGCPNSERNAYMLLYRKIEKNKDVRIESYEVPDIIQEYVNKTRTTVTVHYASTNYNELNTTEYTWSKYLLNAGMTVQATKLKAMHKLVKGAASQDPANFRLVRVNSTFTTTAPYVDEQQVVTSEDLGDCHLWLQQCAPGDTFSSRAVGRFGGYCVLLLNPVDLKVVAVKRVPLDILKTPAQQKPEIFQEFGCQVTAGGVLAVADMISVDLLPDDIPLKESMSKHNRLIAIPVVNLSDVRNNIQLFVNLNKITNLLEIDITLPPYHEREEEATSPHAVMEHHFCQTWDPNLKNKEAAVRIVSFLIDKRCSVGKIKDYISKLLNIDRKEYKMDLITNAITFADYKKGPLRRYHLISELYGSSLNRSVSVHLSPANYPVKILMYLFEPTPTPPMNHLRLQTELTIGIQSTIGDLKKLTIAKMAEKGCVDLVYDMCRIRDVECRRYVSTIRPDPLKIEYLMDDLESRLEFCIQRVPMGAKLYTRKTNMLFLFLQEVNPENLKLGSKVFEIMFHAKANADQLLADVLEKTGIPQEYIKLLLGKTKYPNSMPDLKMDISCWYFAKYLNHLYEDIYCDGHVLYYCDTRLLTQSTDEVTTSQSVCPKIVLSDSVSSDESKVASTPSGPNNKVNGSCGHCKGSNHNDSNIEDGSQSQAAAAGADITSFKRNEKFTAILESWQAEADSTVDETDQREDTSEPMECSDPPDSSNCNAATKSKADATQEISVETPSSQGVKGKMIGPTQSK